MNDEKTNRGRSAEARDPARPVDEAGEKEGLGPREGQPVEDQAEEDAAATDGGAAEADEETGV